jgi:TLD
MILLNTDSVDEYIHRLLTTLFEVKVKAQSCIELVTAYRDKTQSFTTAEFLTMTKDVYDFLAPLQQSREVKDSLNFHKVPEALPVEIKIDITVDHNPLMFDDYAVETFGLKLPEQELFVKWLDLIAQVPKLTLVYRGTRDTFKAARFHELTDNKGPTISIIKSKCGKVFGGYTSAPWTSVRGYKKDEKAFLFSLTSKIKYRAKDPMQNKVGHTPEYLIVFGKPNDLWLKADCDVQKNPYRVAKYIYTL